MPEHATNPESASAGDQLLRREPERLPVGPAEVAEPDEDSEFVQFLDVMWQRRWWVVGTVALFVGIAALQLRGATPIFQATSQIRYEPTAARIVDFGEIGRTVSAQDEFNTQMELIRGPQVTRMVLDALGTSAQERTREQTEAAIRRQEREEAPTPIEQARRLYRTLRFKMRDAVVPYVEFSLRDDEIAEQNRINALRRRVKVAQVPETKLINITVRHPDPREAAKIANAYADQYRLSLVLKRDTAYETAKKFYDTQIVTAKARLEQAERDVLEAGGDSELKLLQQEEELVVARIRDLQTRIYEVDDQVAMAQSTNFAQAPPEVRELILADDPEVKALRTSIDQLLLERVTLAADNMPNHPDIVNVDQRLAALEDHMTSKVLGFETTWQGRIKLLEDQRRALVEERQKAQARVDELQSRMINYRLKERSAAEEGDLYNMLLSGFNQVNVSSNAESNNVTIEEYAVPPSVPAEPNVGRTLLLHGMLGTFLGCVLALGLNLLDRSMRDPKAVQAQTGLPNLGIIPYLGGTFLKNPLPGKARSRVRLITEFDPYSNETESFRLLRTSLQYSTPGHTPQAIMITSSMPSEGKTTACVNLAISFAGLGEKTLLVDADLKLPSVHRVFGINRGPGLSDILTGQKRLDDAIVSSGIEGMDILPAGPDAPNPVELLESGKMDEVIAELRRRYRHVVIDAPPLYGMSDSYVLARKIDGLCLMASLGKTRNDVFRRTVASLAVLKIRVLGIVFNNQIRNYRGSGQYGYYKTMGGYGYMRRSRGRYNRRAAEEKA